MRTLECFMAFLLVFSFAKAERIISGGWYNTSVLCNGLQLPNSNITINTGGTLGTPQILEIPRTNVSVMTVATSEDGMETNQDIINLTNMLDNDPDKIFEYVRDNIKTELYYGVKKGALMTLYEKSGNDYDKCVLAMTLLKAAGKDAEYYYHKTIDLIPVNRPGANSVVMSLADMFGITADLTNTENENLLLNKLFATRIPFQIIMLSETTKAVLMPRYKIGRLYNSNNSHSVYELAGKKKSLNTIYDVKSATGITSTELLTSAGGTLDVSSGTVTSINETGLNATLTKYSANLSGEMTNDVTRESGELTGDQSFTTQQYSYNQLLNYDGNNTNNYYMTFEEFYANTYANCIRMYNAANGDIGMCIGTTPNSNLVMVFYKEVPSFDYSKLIIYDGTTTTVLKTINLADLHGERLWVSFNGNTGYLKLGDTTLLTRNVTSDNMQLSFAIKHGYDDLFYDNASYAQIEKYREISDTEHKQLQSFRKGNSFAYNIAYGYSDASALLAKRQGIYADKLSNARAVSGNFDSDGNFILTNGNLNDTQKDLLAEGLNVMGLTWLAQTYKSSQAIAYAHGCYSQYEHRMGKIAQEEGFYIDVNLQMSAATSASLNSADASSAFRLSGFYASAMEHGVIQQLQNGAEAISTANIFHYANSRNNPFVILKTATQVDSLVGYSDAEKNSIKAVFTDLEEGEENPFVLIPKNRTCVPDAWSWKGYGYVVFSNIRAGMIISGNLNTQNGGYSAYPLNYSFQSTYSQIYSAPSYSSINTSFSTYTNINNYLPTFLTPKAYSEDPVDMFSGAYIYETQDISIDDTLAFNRVYNSNLNESKDCGTWVWLASQLRHKCYAENGVGGELRQGNCGAGIVFYFFNIRR